MRTQSEWKVEISGRGEKGTGPFAAPFGPLRQIGPVPFAQQGRGPLLHLVGRLVGEGDGQDPLRPRAVADQFGDAVGDHAGLSGSRPRQHQQRPGERVDGVVLGGVQVHPRIVSRRGRRAQGGRASKYRAIDGCSRLVFRPWYRLGPRERQPLPDLKSPESPGPDGELEPASLSGNVGQWVAGQVCFAGTGERQGQLHAGCRLVPLDFHHADFHARAVLLRRAHSCTAAGATVTNPLAAGRSPACNGPTRARAAG